MLKGRRAFEKVVGINMFYFIQHLQQLYPACIWIIYFVNSTQGWGTKPQSILIHVSLKTSYLKCYLIPRILIMYCLQNVLLEGNTRMCELILLHKHTVSIPKHSKSGF